MSPFDFYLIHTLYRGINRDQYYEAILETLMISVVILYLVEVLLNVIDVLLHFVSIPLQPFDQQSRFRTRASRRAETNKQTV